MFGLSVVGILVSIFSCMLVYQVVYMVVVVKMSEDLLLCVIVILTAKKPTQKFSKNITSEFNITILDQNLDSRS